MSVPVRLTVGDCWEFKGQRLRFERELGGGLLHFIVERTLAPFQIEDAFGGSLAPDTAWLLHGLASGALRRIADRRGPLARKDAEGREDDCEALLKLDSQARLRAFVVRGLEAMGEVPRSERAIRLALAKLWAAEPERAARIGAKPSPRSVRRWLAERGTPGERRLRQMISMSGRVARKRRLPPLVVELLRRAALWYWSRRGWSQADAYSRMARLIFRINRLRWSGGHLPLLRLPSPETLRQEIRLYECCETYAAKHGEKAATTRFKASGKGLSAQRFLQLGCMDHTVLDGVAIIDADWMLPVGRPTLTVLMDVRTRCIVGFVLSFEPPSIYSVMECIKRANRPKLHLPGSAARYPVLGHIFGRFDEIVVDNGKEFVGTSLEDALADVGVALRFAPIASPTYKAMVERFFGTLNKLLNHKLPGGVLKPELLREMGYDPAKDAVLTLAEIEELIWEALTVYHTGLHTGVGAPPAQLWQADIDAYGIDVIDDDRQLDKMMGAVETRRLSKSGIEIFGLQYHDPATVGGLLEELTKFEPVRGQRKGSATAQVKVKYNPVNLSEVHAWNRQRNQYVTLPCLDEKYSAGMSLWHHRKIQEWSRLKGLEFTSEEDRLVARAKFISLIETSAPGLKGKDRRAALRLRSSPKVQSLAGEAPMLAYASSRHDGLAPVIPHETLASMRNDDGQASSRPARSKKRSPKGRKVNPPQKPSILAPETGREADFSIDYSGWKEIDL